MVWRQVLSAKRDNAIFRSWLSGKTYSFRLSGGPILHPMQTERAQNIYAAATKDVLSSLYPETFCMIASVARILVPWE